MKRRSLVAVVSCVLVLTACGSEAPAVDPAPVEVAETIVGESQPEATDQVTEEVPAVEEAVEEVSAEETVEEVAVPESLEPALSDMESYLQSKGVLSGERTMKAGNMIGAIDGCGYDGCELYIYDTSSEAYQKVVNGEEIFIEGMESLGGITFDAVNGPFVLILKGAGSDLVDAFNSYK